MKKLKLSHYLFILATIPAITLCVMFYNGSAGLSRVENLTSMLYEHPYKVSNSIKDVKNGLLELQCMRLDQATASAIGAGVNQVKIIELEKGIKKSINVLKTAFLGDLSQIKEIEEHYNSWLLDMKSKKPASGVDDKAYDLLIQKVNEVNDFANGKGQEFYDIALENSKNIKSKFFFIAVLSESVLILVSFLISRKLSKKLNRMTKRLKESAKVVLSESEEISSSSKNLSDSTNNSASALQESAAAIEELSAMVKNNVGQAQISKTTATEMVDSANLVCDKTKELIKSMDKISEGNQDISKLVTVIEEIANKTKIIDDIVFQTKILSFNASVEAERAGEHGKGFSVVAQEVSNLARMSGNASMEISEIVRSSVKNAKTIFENNTARVDSGSNILNELAAFIKAIEDNSQVVQLNADQILSASQDQAAGINQMNEAIGQLDQTTQMNASMATQSTNASIELNQQARKLEEIVRDLDMLINGNGRWHCEDADDDSKREEQENVISLSSKVNSTNHKGTEVFKKEFKKISNGADSWYEI